MDLNELVVQEILDSQKDIIYSYFKEKLQNELSKKEKEMKSFNQFEIEKLKADLNQKNKSLQEYTNI